MRSHPGITTPPFQGDPSSTRRGVFVVGAPHQVGKTTLVQQVAADSGLVHRYASADEPTLRGGEWMEQQWDAARLAARDAGRAGALLVLDEVQKIPGWPQTVKRLWDADTAGRVPLKVVLPGSAPLLTRVDKPALLRRLFELGCAYSGQVLSYQKMLGQLQDAGNTTTLAHYLELLAGAGMVCGLQKFAGAQAPAAELFVVEGAQAPIKKLPVPARCCAAHRDFIVRVKTRNRAAPLGRARINPQGRDERYICPVAQHPAVLVAVPATAVGT